jgi:hypothetical protein
MSETRRRFVLTVDSGRRDEPEPRRFRYLDTAVAAFNGMDDEWKRWCWITEDTKDGGSITHMRDGHMVEE